MFAFFYNSIAVTSKATGTKWSMISMYYLSTLFIGTIDRRVTRVHQPHPSDFHRNLNPWSFGFLTNGLKRKSKQKIYFTSGSQRPALGFSELNLLVWLHVFPSSQTSPIRWLIPQRRATWNILVRRVLFSWDVRVPAEGFLLSIPEVECDSTLRGILFANIGFYPFELVLFGVFSFGNRSWWFRGPLLIGIRVN